MPSTIPLTPAQGGGVCIAEDALQSADVIVSTTSAFVSRAIRFASGGDVSHASVYVGDGEVIEAIGEGVVRRSLTAALADASLAVAYRMKGMTPATAAAVVGFASKQVGSGYDYVGVGGQALQQGRTRLIVCQLNVVCHLAARQVGRTLEMPSRFFCSELVAEAYRQAGVPLLSVASNQVSPSRLVEVAVSGRLRYLGHLRA